MQYPPCPECNSGFVYEDRGIFVCLECAHEWSTAEVKEAADFIVRDSNGTILRPGDKITLIKGLKVKGSSQGLKIGTKTTIRRIVEGKDHELDCKFSGVGEIMVTAKFVKKT